MKENILMVLSLVIAIGIAIGIILFKPAAHTYLLSYIKKPSEDSEFQYCNDTMTTRLPLGEALVSFKKMEQNGNTNISLCFLNVIDLGK